MKDKNYDDFFDDKTGAENAEAKLMAMVDTVELPQEELETGAYVSGTVQNIGKEHVFVAIGQKNEGVINKAELIDKDGKCTVAEGDVIEAYVIAINPDEILMSKTLSGHKSRTKDLLDAMEKRIPVEGKVTGINKGGFNVTIMGRKAFCPFSHMDTKFVNEPNSYLSQTYNFIISRVESRGKNIVLSRLPILERELHARFEELEQLKIKKTVLHGTVSRVTDFGLFVSLGDVEGLVHISEVSWDRSEDLNQSFEVGQPIACVILKIEKNEPLRNSKISLSIKMAGENPWDTIAQKLTVGSSVEGTITRLTTFGAFVLLLPGIEGLIHISEMSWNKKVRDPSDVVSVGAKVLVSILAIDTAKRSVSCSLKDVTDNPWNTVVEKYPVGSLVNGTVASETKYGFFVDLDTEITGLLSHVNVAKEKKGTIKKDDTIEVFIEDINAENHRISLSYGLDKTSTTERAVIEHYADTQEKKTPANESSEFGAMLRAAMAKKK